MTAPREVQASVERVERKEPPEPEGWVPLYWSRVAEGWMTGSLCDTRDEAMVYMEDEIDNKRLVRIPPAPPEAAIVPEAVRFSLNELDTIRYVLFGAAIGKAVNLDEAAKEEVIALERRIHRFLAQPSAPPAAPSAGEGKVPVEAIRRLSVEYDDSSPFSGYSGTPSGNALRESDWIAVRSWLSGQPQPDAKVEPLTPEQKRETGIYDKFRVERTDGKSAPGQKHDGCSYFVLDLDHDKFAWPALDAYSTYCEEEFPVLAADLRRITDPNLAAYGMEPLAEALSRVPVPAATEPDEAVEEIPLQAINRYFICTCLGSVYFYSESLSGGDEARREDERQIREWLRARLGRAAK